MAQGDIFWHPNGRHCLESELGLSAGRQRGIRESLGTVLVFVDDDNVLDANYLSTALSIGKEWPRLGTWGSGATIPEFERQPSETLKVLLPFLTLRDADAPQWGNVPVEESILGSRPVRDPPIKWSAMAHEHRSARAADPCRIIKVMIT